MRFGQLEISDLIERIAWRFRRLLENERDSHQGDIGTGGGFRLIDSHNRHVVAIVFQWTVDSGPEIRSWGGDKMNWLFSDDSGHSNLMMSIFEIANWISGIILLLTTVVLLYFLKKKRHETSDSVFFVVTTAIFLLGIKKVITIWLQGWAAYSWYCILVEVGIATVLLILIWLLPPLILKILAMASREDLIVGLIEESTSKIAAQDSATSLEIRNSELQAMIFKIDMILNIQHRLGNQSEAVTQLRNVISSAGDSSRGD
jgi:hypothetical protein